MPIGGVSFATATGRDVGAFSRRGSTSSRTTAGCLGSFVLPNSTGFGAEGRVLSPLPHGGRWAQGSEVSSTLCPSPNSPAPRFHRLPPSATQTAPQHTQRVALPVRSCPCPERSPRVTISLLTLPRARCFTPRVRVLQQSTGLRIGPNGRTSPTAIAIHVNVARETDSQSPTVENQSAVGSREFKADAKDDGAVGIVL